MHSETPYVPPELVELHILPRLPVKSLLRFRCVCSAWRDTIDEDDSFHHEHLRLQETSLLLAPQVRQDRDYYGLSTRGVVKTAGLYRWEKSQQGAATLVHGMADYHTYRTYDAARHDMAHCDGLVLLPTEVTVSVLNPATRRVRTLPWSLRTIFPRAASVRRMQSHQAFGLGHDPRSNTYKVARFFYRSVVTPAMDGANDNYALGNGIEIFTIGGTDQSWRDINKSSPYPIKPGRTATFCKGSLIWTVEASLLEDKKSTPGFVRLNLEDESFSVVPPPPPCCRSALNGNAMSRLADLRGELCLAHSGPPGMSLEIWMCNGLDDNRPQWNRRHVVALEILPMPGGDVCPKAMFDDEIVFQFGHYNLLRYNYRTGECALRDMVHIPDLRYGNPDNNDATGTLVEYTSSVVHVFDTIPYVPSLAPVM